MVSNSKDLSNYLIVQNMVVENNVKMKIALQVLSVVVYDFSKHIVVNSDEIMMVVQRVLRMNYH